MDVSKINVVVSDGVRILPIAEEAPGKKSLMADGAPSNRSEKRASGAGQRRLRTETVALSLPKTMAIDPREAEEIAQLIMKYTNPRTGASAIFNAAQANDDYAVKKLLSYGGDPKEALRGSIYGKSMNLMKYLVENVGAKIENPFYFISSAEWWDGFDYLAGRGEAVPYDYLLDTHFIYPNIIRQLVARGAKFDSNRLTNFWERKDQFCSDNYSRNSLNEIINAYSRESRIPLNEYFDINNMQQNWIKNLKEKHLLHIRSIKGPRGNWGIEQCTPLQYAIICNDMALTETLLKAGADPNFENSSPMKMAKAIGNIKMIGLLIRYGAKVDGA